MYHGGREEVTEEGGCSVFCCFVVCFLKICSLQKLTLIIFSQRMLKVKNSLRFKSFLDHMENLFVFGRGHNVVSNYSEYWSLNVSFVVY